MVILETGLIFSGQLLVEKKFYPENYAIQADLIGNLINEALDMANHVFADKLAKFSLGDYSIHLQSKELDDKPENEEFQPKLIIFCITEKDVNQKSLNEGMMTALNQFCLRYPKNDIKNVNIPLFQEFSDRLSTIFSDLALNLEDRFKGMF